MKRLTLFLLAIVIISALCSCGTGRTSSPEELSVPGATAPAQTAPDVTPVPTEPPAPAGLVLEEPERGWSEAYVDFLNDNYDILAALWPDGITGVGFIDLDLDSTPEMVLFDQGASATLGVQLFDQIDGQVYCVSSTNENARGAFDDKHLSSMTVCASFFEAFRLSSTEDGYRFWVSSANGTMETAWDEIVSFGEEDGVLTLTSVCTRWLETDPETGVVVEERYTAYSQEAEEADYRTAATRYTDARDTGYDARGVFLWNDMQSYDTTCEGLLAMARDAVKAYVPIAVS